MFQKTVLYCASVLLTFNLYASDKTIVESKGYDASQFIDVGSPNTKHIRIAITNFFIDRDGQKSPSLSNAKMRFGELLDFTNWFYLIPENTFPDSVKKPENALNADPWKALKADYVVQGKFLSEKNREKYDIEFSLLDVKKNRIVAKKSYRDLYIPNSILSSTDTDSISESLNLVLRDFGDLAVYAMTGKSGPFMSQIAFVGRKSKDARSSQIYIADFDGKHARPITSGDTIHLSPSWSPDGKKILYTSFQTQKAEIFEYNLATRKTRQVTYANANSSGAVWNQAGDLIAFSSSTNEGRTHLYTTTGPGAPKEPLVTSSRIAVEPAFSPDGTRLAYTSNLYAKPMIFILDFRNNKTTRITYSGWYNASAAWNPDSDLIAFASFDKKINRWDLFRIHPDGSNFTRLTLREGDNEKPTWSPDGRLIMYQSNRGDGKYIDTIRGNTYKLYVMDPDGEHQKLLKTTIPDARQPAWSPRLPALK